MAVHHRHRLGQRVDPHHAQHGAEDLFLVDAHRRLDAVEQATAQEKSLLVAGHLQPATIADELRALLDPEIHIATHSLEVLAGHERPHFDARQRAGPDLERLDLPRQLRHQGIRGRLPDTDRDRDGHAALAAGTVGGAHQRSDRVVEVRVRHDDGVVLRPTEGLDPFAGHAA